MMNPEIKARWVAALRSGDYKQGGGRLCRQFVMDGSKEFCCLGVLAEVTGKLVQRNSDGHSSYAIPYPNGHGETDWARYRLPDELLPEFGITWEMQNRLIAMNDEENKTFSEIADYVEGNL